MKNSSQKEQKHSDSTCLSSSSQNQKEKVVWQLPGAAGNGNGELLLNGYKIQFHNIEKFWRWLYNYVDISNTTEPHT